MNVLTQLKADPASFGGGGGDIIADTALHPGPYYALKALGGDVVIATAQMPAGWTANGLDGATISDGDTLLLPGVSSLTLTSGTLVAYKMTNKQVSA